MSSWPPTDPAHGEHHHLSLLRTPPPSYEYPTSGTPSGTVIPFAKAFELDGIALELLKRDIEQVDDRMLALPTPCDGWSVLDLINHMNIEHVAIFGRVVSTDADPRDEFSTIIDRWVAFFEPTAERNVRVPKIGADIPSSVVLSVHFADMVVHRWDLTTAIGAACPVPKELFDAAAEVAGVVTAPRSGLVGPDGVYKPSLEADPTATPLENLVRQYGRNHRWAESRRELTHDQSRGTLR